MVEGDLSARIAVDRTDTELGQVASALNLAFDRLRGSVERQRRFTADASHELRTPVATMMAELEWALLRDRSTGDYKESLETCHRAGARMQSLIEGLLTLARADSGELPVRQVPVRLDELVDEAVDPAAAPRRAAPGDAAGVVERADDCRGSRQAARAALEPPLQRGGVQPPERSRDASTSTGQAQPWCSRFATPASGSTPTIFRACSTGSIAASWRARVSPPAPGWASRWCIGSPRPTAGPSRARASQAAGRNSSCGFRPRTPTLTRDSYVGASLVGSQIADDANPSSGVTPERPLDGTRVTDGTESSHGTRITRIARIGDRPWETLIDHGEIRGSASREAVTVIRVIRVAVKRYSNP